jgi:hypothetical protein
MIGKCEQHALEMVLAVARGAGAGLRATLSREHGELVLEDVAGRFYAVDPELVPEAFGDGEDATAVVRIDVDAEGRLTGIDYDAVATAAYAEELAAQRAYLLAGCHLRDDSGEKALALIEKVLSRLDRFASK